MNGVEEEELERAIDRRVDLQILTNHRDMDRMKKVFGEDYVDTIIENKGNRSFADDIGDMVKTLLRKKTKPTPKLTVLDGGSDE